MSIAKAKFLPLLAALVLVAGPVLAQHEDAVKGPPEAKEGPQLPPGMAKALTDSSYAIAYQAAMWGSPAVIMYALRDHDATGPNPKAAPNDIWRMENTSTPELAEKAGYVMPNLSVIYGFGFLDLRQEPVVMTYPDSKGLYYMIETLDMWTNAFAYPAGVKNGYKGGKVAFVAPGWKGELPADVKRIDCPTPWILIQPRVHLPNEAGLEAARNVLSNIKTQTLSSYLGKQSPTVKTNYEVPNFVDPKLPVSVLDFKDPLQFWDLLSAVINENPPPKDEITALVPMFAPLGIELGKKWDRSKVNPLILKAMAQAAQDVPLALASLPAGRLTNGWYIPPPSIGNYKKDYQIRAFVARNGLTANTPEEAVYFLARTDSTGQAVTGAHNYTMTFKQTPPFHEPSFWALRMFDGVSLYPVRNPINRYVLGRDFPDMRKNADGTVTVYLQNQSPGKDKESNWLPTPTGPFIMILGTYAPGDAVIKSLSNPVAFVAPAAVLVK
jgi:DNA sulfur modification protein DndE